MVINDEEIVRKSKKEPSWQIRPNRDANGEIVDAPFKKSNVFNEFLTGIVENPNVQPDPSTSPAFTYESSSR